MIGTSLASLAAEVSHAQATNAFNQYQSDKMRKRWLKVMLYRGDAWGDGWMTFCVMHGVSLDEIRNVDVAPVQKIRPGSVDFGWNP